MDPGVMSLIGTKLSFTANNESDTASGPSLKYSRPTEPPFKARPNSVSGVRALPLVVAAARTRSKPLPPPKPPARTTSGGVPRLPLPRSRPTRTTLDDTADTSPRRSSAAVRGAPDVRAHAPHRENCPLPHQAVPERGSPATTASLRTPERPPALPAKPVPKGVASLSIAAATASPDDDMGPSGAPAESPRDRERREKARACRESFERAAALSERYGSKGGRQETRSVAGGSDQSDTGVRGPDLAASSSDAARRDESIDDADKGPGNDGPDLDSAGDHGHDRSSRRAVDAEGAGGGAEPDRGAPEAHVERAMQNVELAHMATKKAALRVAIARKEARIALIREKEREARLQDIRRSRPSRAGTSAAASGGGQDGAGDPAFRPGAVAEAVLSATAPAALRGAPDPKRESSDSAAVVVPDGGAGGSAALPRVSETRPSVRGTGPLIPGEALGGIGNQPVRAVETRSAGPPTAANGPSAAPVDEQRSLAASGAPASLSARADPVPPVQGIDRASDGRSGAAAISTTPRRIGGGRPQTRASPRQSRDAAAAAMAMAASSASATSPSPEGLTVSPCGIRTRPGTAPSPVDSSTRSRLAAYRAKQRELENAALANTSEALARQRRRERVEERQRRLEESDTKRALVYAINHLMRCVEQSRMANYHAAKLRERELEEAHAENREKGIVL